MYAFAIICFELFDGECPYGTMHPVQAAYHAAMEGLRPTWHQSKRCLHNHFCQSQFSLCLFSCLIERIKLLLRPTWHQSKR